MNVFCAIMLLLIWFELSSMRHGWRWIKRRMRKSNHEDYI